MRAFAITTRAALLAATVMTGGAGIAHAAPVDEVFELLRLDDLMEVMREEGLSSGAEMAASMGLRPDSIWQERVGAIYDIDVMEDVLRSALAESLDPAIIPDLTDFFTSDPGEDFLKWEIEARRALLDPDVEQAAQEAAAAARANDNPRLPLITAYIDANDIIESNVTGGMNGSYAFYRGMRAGGALPPELTDSMILQDVWQQEETLRENTTDWAYTYLFMAYAPADDAALEAYIAFSESEAGQGMSSALFAAFDTLFVTLSEAMGLAVAQRLAVMEL